MAVWWSKGDFSFLSMHVCVCLKIMTPKGKQNYVRRIIERAREFMESSRKKKKGKKKKKRESWRKKGRGRFWNQVESKGKKKREDGILWVYMCGGQNVREKK